MLEERLTEVIGVIGGCEKTETVVAIDGHSAAGKSTFAARLAAAVVHGDDFYRVMDDADRAALRPVEGAVLYFDWERLRDEALGPLRSGARTLRADRRVRLQTPQ